MASQIRPSGLCHTDPAWGASQARKVCRTPGRPCPSDGSRRRAAELAEEAHPPLDAGTAASTFRLHRITSLPANQRLSRLSTHSPPHHRPCLVSLSAAGAGCMMHPGPAGCSGVGEVVEGEERPPEPWPQQPLPSGPSSSRCMMSNHPRSSISYRPVPLGWAGGGKRGQVQRGDSSRSLEAEFCYPQRTGGSRGSRLWPVNPATPGLCQLRIGWGQLFPHFLTPTPAHLYLGQNFSHWHLQ